jgi:hypothetical protein
MRLTVGNIGGMILTVGNIGGMILTVRNIGGVILTVGNIGGMILTVRNIGGMILTVRNIGGMILTEKPVTITTYPSPLLTYTNSARRETDVAFSDVAILEGQFLTRIERKTPICNTGLLLTNACVRVIQVFVYINSQTCPESSQHPARGPEWSNSSEIWAGRVERL